MGYHSMVDQLAVAVWPMAPEVAVAGLALRVPRPTNFAARCLTVGIGPECGRVIDELACAPWFAHLRGTAVGPRCFTGQTRSWRANGGTVASLGGSGGNRRLRLRIVGWVEFLSVARTKRTIVDGAANLEEEIGPSPRPAHVLRFVHPPIDQEIGRPLRDRGTNPQAGTVPLGVIDHPVALAGEIAIQRVQGGP